MADSRTGKEIYEMGLKHLVAPESKGSAQETNKSPIMRVMSKGHRSQLKKL